ncbi:MAG TPA: hypothetical protein VJV96_09630 [Candidatus Angelobacter sp.]|jgi:hypothetical protein|nr:hypothetical protein [Candidatus Angelobacter sp.]
MVDHKRDVTKREFRKQEHGQAEASPNPHNENNVIEIPVRTDQRKETAGENVAQTPSTREGVLHPSVGEGVGGGVADTDSMFNEADPQTEEILSSETRKRRGNRKRKPA